jgi:serine protease
MPNDPALRLNESGFTGVPAGTKVQWALARERFPAAWDISNGTNATVGVLDTGIDGSHPELATKIFYGAEYGTSSGAFSDQEGHGTHVSGLACANTDDGLAVAGAGWNCKVGVEKIPLLRDGDVIAGIEHAASRGVHAINMSFGGGPESAAIDRAIDFAVERNVVLVSSASNSPDEDQGSPAAQLQKDASNINAGRGLVVTAANFHDRRAGTGRGEQISVAAYGFFDEFDGPPGLISTFPGNRTNIDGITGCGCRSTRFGDGRYAYLQGTSMASPQVAALAALVGQLNPFLGVGEKIRIIKQTARGGGSWNPELGWGIIDAGRALDATRRVDKTAPRTRSRAVGRVRLRRIRRGRRRGRLRRTARVRIRLLGGDRPGAPRLLPSGLRSFDIYISRVRRGRPYRFKRVRRDQTNRVLRVRLKRGRYRIYSRAIDNAGNREAKPPHWDARSIVVKPRRRKRR